MTDPEPDPADDLPEDIDLTVLECRHGCAPPTDVHPDCALHASDDRVVERYRRDTCPACNGRGVQVVGELAWDAPDDHVVDEHGIRQETTCPACDGTGWRDGDIPAWVEDIPQAVRDRLGWTIPDREADDE